MFPRNRHGEDLACERRSVSSFLQGVSSIVPLVTIASDNFNRHGTEEPRVWISVDILSAYKAHRDAAGISSASVQRGKRVSGSDRD